MKLDILQIGNPILQKPALEVENIQSAEVQKLINDMLDTCKAGADATAGLAAPQVGVGLRIAVVRRVDLEEELEELEIQNAEDTQGKKKRKKKARRIDPNRLWEVLINPKILETAPNNSSLLWEACLSVGKGKDMIWGPVYRPNQVKIRYSTPAGETNEITGEGYFAHVILHELDHLDGVLFLSRVKNPERNLWKGRDFEKFIDNYGEYPPVK